jgi:hypothetical protein
MNIKAYLFLAAGHLMLLSKLGVISKGLGLQRLQRSFEPPTRYSPRAIQAPNFIPRIQLRNPIRMFLSPSHSLPASSVDGPLISAEGENTLLVVTLG